MDPFVAEIVMMGSNFAPRGYAMCNGQTLPISQNTALFSLLGTTYGGNGTTNFALPNLQGRTPISAGQGSGLTQRNLGETGGAATVTLLQSQLPNHGHTVSAKVGGNLNSPTNNLPANPAGRPAPNLFANSAGTAQNMGASAVAIAGSSLPHNNLMPYNTLVMCIAMQGIFPSRS